MSSRDLLLFYVFFELTLVPMFFIIGIWGGPDRRRAAGKFFLFTFTGSVFTLAAAIYLGMKYGTFDIQDPSPTTAARYGVAFAGWGADAGRPLTANELAGGSSLGFFAGFAVKVPLCSPVHTWLPLAHYRSPNRGPALSWPACC